MRSSSSTPTVRPSGEQSDDSILVADADFKRVRIPSEVYSQLKAFADAREMQIGDSIQSLLTSYKHRTGYQFAPDASDVILEMQALEEGTFLLNRMSMEVVESLRRLAELKEAGILSAYDQIRLNLEK